jgi:hypothetical protein
VSDIELTKALRSIAQLQAREMLSKAQRCMPPDNVSYCDKVATVECQSPHGFQTPTCDEHDSKLETRPMPGAQHIRQLLAFVEEGI